MANAFVYVSPVGELLLREEGQALTGVHFGGQTALREGDRLEESLLLRQAARELDEYFAGERRRFSLPLAPKGTPFQQKVWAALLEIPYGETRTYGQIAAAIGQPTACRAVGMANNKNPIAIVVPCHRVVGANGSLTGYAGGLSVKEKLLQLEQEETP
ncbi:methylated-DNA--[protein]-cysteine S-methyltransferase [Zongyangia hominis]|uniref:Methylated-DNA--protein-cysteine methyltransferase n=1 Tax=Zongyangia hominis TaxID=2763677 RepID=A0A926EFS6_9FIRM|nr:methylated-DNA--[protein]-cysteine S-methyltransferase [Zongyangia hominis]MBC8571359.1 methylated-DNA--[protein]-cysteine S-methyltransferase [Zongyangia hominis]